MGMFTSILNKDGREFQIKTGHDECKIYKLKQRIDFEIPDGVYHAIGDAKDYDSSKKFIYKWVTIKNGRVHAIDRATSVESTNGRNRLWIKYKVNRWRELPKRVRNVVYNGNLVLDPRTFAEAIAAPFKHSRESYVSIGRKILGVTEVKDKVADAKEKLAEAQETLQRYGEGNKWL
jgi:hypothetical protein